MRILCFVSTRVVALAFSLVLAISHAATGQDAPQTKSVEVFGKGKMTIPSEFKSVKPRINMIDHEYRVGEGETTARMTMMRSGGGIEPNIKRWRGQISGGDKEAQKVEKMKVGDWEVHLADLSGSYAESMGGGPFAPGRKVMRQNYRMLGAILDEPDGDKLYFVKMIGPESVVKANRERFVEMIKSLAK